MLDPMNQKKDFPFLPMMLLLSLFLIWLFLSPFLFQVATSPLLGLWLFGGLLAVALNGLLFLLLHRTCRKAQGDERRVRSIIERTGTTLFEWDMQRDRVRFSQKGGEKFGFSPTVQGLFANLEQWEQVDPQDLGCLWELLNSGKLGRAYGEAAIRLRGTDGEYAWNRVSLLTTHSHFGAPSKAIGLIIDIDSEMREAQRYKSRAERDPLTGLYNKGTIGSMVDQCLQGEGLLGIHALIMVDLDNFKTINDSKGHLCGDNVLMSAGHRLQELFLPGDLLGRVGGDEFVFFQKNISGEKAAQKMGESICQMFHREGGFEGCSISGSVGISLYPRDGRSYETLYHRADLALYQAKHRGKNQYCLYSSQNVSLTNLDSHGGEGTNTSSPK